MSVRLNVALAVLVMALGAAFATLVLRDDAGRDGAAAAEPAETAEQDAAVRAAADQVRALLDLDHSDVDAQLSRVLQSTTADFRRQFDRQAGTIRRETLRRRSSADVTLLRAGLVAASSGSATVLVAADTEVTSRTRRVVTRKVPWRIRVDLVRDGDRWLTAGLGFVN